MSKLIKNTPKNPNNHLTKHSNTCSSINGKVFTKTVIPKKVLVSNKISDMKSCSTGVITAARTKHKKITKSEGNIPKNNKENNEDFCKRCGDYKSKHILNDDSKKTEYSEYNIPNIINKLNSRIIQNERKKSMQQYYKNENFNISTNSIVENNDRLKKSYLSTIKEDAEVKSKDTIFEIYDDIDSSDVIDENTDNIEDIKEFRQNNFFECHSTKSRLKKGSVTSLEDHKCVYRFYLNDRLFPVPLNADYNGTVRCVECHLPMCSKIGGNDEKINGTIQAKVTLRNKIQDLTLLLPIKEPLIIKERRKQENRLKEIVYFGLIKLDKSGDSVFNRVFPSDSLALKYQKGYKEHAGKDVYRYNRIEDSDVIII